MDKGCTESISLSLPSPHGDWQSHAQREAGWMPPPGLSVHSHRDTFCLSSSSVGSQSPSNLPHQGPQMAHSVEHVVMKGGTS